MKFLLIAALSLTACGEIQRSYTSFVGEFTYKCSKSGVEYVQSDSGIAVHVDADGKPVLCGSTK